MCNVGVRGIVVALAMEMSLSVSIPHSHSVFSCPVTSASQTLDSFLLNTWYSAEEKKDIKNILITDNTHITPVYSRQFSTVMHSTYNEQGTFPSRTLISVTRPVKSFLPVIVRVVPPACGPLRGETSISFGSLKDARLRDTIRRKSGFKN